MNYKGGLMTNEPIAGEPIKFGTPTLCTMDDKDRLAAIEAELFDGVHNFVDYTLPDLLLNLTPLTTFVKPPKRPFDR
jgi:hypothetical protein